MKNYQRPLHPRVYIDRFFGLFFTASVLVTVLQFTLLEPIPGFKLISIFCLLIFWMGTSTAKNWKYNWRKACLLTAVGLLLYIPADNLLFGVAGYIFLFLGSRMIVRLIKGNHYNDIFNCYNESFPQQERLIENKYSVNFKMRYLLRGKLKKGYINIINPFRGTLIIGLPGAGKTHFIIQQIIRQHIRKNFAMFIWDFKFSDLTQIAYDVYRQSDNRAKFHIIAFDDLQLSDRCNPIDRSLLHDTGDAAESAKTLLFGLNPGWIQKQDFWVDSAVNLLTAIIYFLRSYRDGQYCTLPHAVELAQVPYDRLFELLRTEPETEVLIQPFASAFESGAAPQLEGMVAGVTVTLGKLATPSLYYLLSGNDCTLDINDPNDPKIICLGSNPQKAGVYGALGSLFITSLSRHLNRKAGHPCSLVMDECSTVYLGGIDQLMATARSNKVAVTLSVQDLSQLEALYGKEKAAVLSTLPGNFFCGQVNGNTAKNISERFGKIVQPKTSLNINDYYEGSVTHAEILELAVPASAIAALSSGEFVGMVADDPNMRIHLKKFKCMIEQDAERMKEHVFPKKRDVDAQTIQKQFLKIKKDIKQIV